MGLAQLLTLLISLPTLVRVWVPILIWYQLWFRFRSSTCPAARGFSLPPPAPCPAAAGPLPPAPPPPGPSSPAAGAPCAGLSSPSLPATPPVPRAPAPAQPPPALCSLSPAATSTAPRPPGASRDRARPQDPVAPAPGRRRSGAPCWTQSPPPPSGRPQPRPRPVDAGRRRALPDSPRRPLARRGHARSSPRQVAAPSAGPRPSAALLCPAAYTPDGRTCRHHGRIHRRGHHRPWHTPPIAPAAPSSELTHGGAPTSPALVRSTPPPRCPCVAAPHRAFPPSLHRPGVTESRPPPTPRSSAPSPRSRPL
jgi:hypothetical protein